MKFVHIFESRKKKARGVTVAYELRQHSLESYNVVCGIAYCSPTERNYSRSLGRKISANRLNYQNYLPEKFKFQMFVTDTDLNGVGMEYLIVSYLKSRTDQKWVESLAKRRLDGYSQEEVTDVVQE